MSEPAAHVFEAVAGVDEAGRGPLAGPVVAAAVVLGSPIDGVMDSKKMTAAARDRFAREIRAGAVSWALGRASAEEIDRLNILNATLLAMQRAVLALSPPSVRVLVDGNRAPDLPLPVETVVGGDDRVPCISAASVLAKVARDREMTAMAERYPGYGFERHKGYPTRAHLAALERLGPTPIHRRSFGPVRRLLDEIGR